MRNVKVFKFLDSEIEKAEKQAEDWQEIVRFLEEMRKDFQKLVFQEKKDPSLKAFNVRKEVSDVTSESSH